MNLDEVLRRWRSAGSPDAASAVVDELSRTRAPRCSTLCVASGKGGTGKSVTSASLAALLSTRGRTLLVDADMGVGNAHILQDQTPPRSFVDVVAGRCTVAEARATCSPSLDLVGGGSGVSRMSALDRDELRLIAQGIAEIEDEYQFLVVDSAAGISEQTASFAAACDLTLVVTTPDITAMTDAYAFLKVLHSSRPRARPLLLVNRVAPGDGDDDGSQTAQRICAVCTKFLGFAPRFVGGVPEDRALVRSVAMRRPVVVSAPESEAARALRTIARSVLIELGERPRTGLGRSLARLFAADSR